MTKYRLTKSCYKTSRPCEEGSATAGNGQVVFDRDSGEPLFYSLVCDHCGSWIVRHVTAPVVNTLINERAETINISKPKELDDVDRLSLISQDLTDAAMDIYGTAQIIEATPHLIPVDVLLTEVGEVCLRRLQG